MKSSITPKIHRLGPSPTKKISHLNPILEESYPSKGKSSFHREDDYSFHAPDQVKMPQPLQQRNTIHFGNAPNNNSHLVIVNNRKYIAGSRSPPRQRSISRMEVVSEKELSLIRKIKVLESRVAEIHKDKQDAIFKLKVENQKLHEQIERMRRASVETERKTDSSRNLSTPIKEFRGLEDDQHEKRVFTLKKIVSNLEDALKESLTKNQNLQKENYCLKEQSICHQNKEFLNSGSLPQKSKLEQEELLKNIQISQIKASNQVLEQRISKLEEQLVDKTSEIKLMQVQLQKKDQTLQRLVQEKEKIIQQNKKKIMQIEELQEKVKEFNRELTEKEKEQQHCLEKSLHNIAEKIENLTQMNDKLQEQNSKIRSQLQFIKEVNSKMNIQFASGIDLKQSQIQKLKEENDFLQKSQIICENRIVNLERSIIEEQTKSNSEIASCTKCRDLMEAIFKLNSKLDKNQ